MGLGWFSRDARPKPSLQEDGSASAPATAIAVSKQLNSLVAHRKQRQTRYSPSVYLAS